MSFGKRLVSADGRTLAPPPPGMQRAQPAAAAPAGPPTLRYDYRPKFGRTLAIVGACLIGAMFMGYIASSNDRGLILYHLIYFDTEGATRFYWFIGAVLGLCGLGAIYTMIITIGEEREVVLGATGITAPKNSFSRETVTVPYARISRAMTASHKGNVLALHLHYDESKLTLHKSMLADDDTFDALIHTIAERSAR